MSDQGMHLISNAENLAQVKRFIAGATGIGGITVSTEGLTPEHAFSLARDFLDLLDRGRTDSTVRAALESALGGTGLRYRTGYGEGWMIETKSEYYDPRRELADRTHKLKDWDTRERRAPVNAKPPRSTRPSAIPDSLLELVRMYEQEGKRWKSTSYYPMKGSIAVALAGICSRAMEHQKQGLAEAPSAAVNFVDLRMLLGWWNVGSFKKLLKDKDHKGIARMLDAASDKMFKLYEKKLAVGAVCTRKSESKFMQLELLCGALVDEDFGAAKRLLESELNVVRNKLSEEKSEKKMSEKKRKRLQETAERLESLLSTYTLGDRTLKAFEQLAQSCTTEFSRHVFQWARESMPHKLGGLDKSFSSAAKGQPPRPNGAKMPVKA